MSLVYFLQRADGQGPIKIGCSSCPEARRRQIGSDTRLFYTLLATAPGTYGNERELHRRFSAHRIENPDLPARRYPVGGRTEWFEAVPALLGLIERVAETGVLPSGLVSKRDTTICRRRAKGETLQSIANDFGITRERVRQIIWEMKRGLAACQRERKAA